jgi:hypothetical protein
MASELKVDKFTGVTTAGSIDVTGEGNSTTTNLQQGLAKVWVKFQGTDTFGINDSFNLTSATDNAVGNHTVSIANDFSDGDYAVVVSANSDFTSGGIGIYAGVTPDNPAMAGGNFTVITRRHDSTADSNYVGITAHGDLA